MSCTFKDNTKEVLEGLSNAKQRGLEAIGLSAEGHAKKGTPVDTGRLRNSISHAVEGDAVYIGSNVDYAPPVELGSRGKDGHHMLQRAATEHTDEYKKLMEGSMRRA